MKQKLIRNKAAPILMPFIHLVYDYYYSFGASHQLRALFPDNFPGDMSHTPAIIINIILFSYIFVCVVLSLIILHHLVYHYMVHVFVSLYLLYLPYNNNNNKLSAVPRCYFSINFNMPMRIYNFIKNVIE